MLLLSAGRTATLWLADMLTANVADAAFTHDRFLPELAARELERWRAALSGQSKGGVARVIGSVGAGARYLPTLVREFRSRLTVGFLWRDPVEQVLSALGRLRERGGVAPGDSWSALAKRTALSHCSEIECGLLVLRAVGLSATHWHMRGYTRPEGFRELASAFDLRTPARLTLTEPRHATPPELVVRPESLDPGVVEYVRDVFERSETIQEAYGEALSRSANDDCGPADREGETQAVRFGKGLPASRPPDRQG